MWSDLRQSIPKWAIRLLAFEVKVFSAITAGMGLSLVLVVPAGILSGFALTALKLEHYASWCSIVIQIVGLTIWFLASRRVYRYLNRRWAPAN